MHTQSLQEPQVAFGTFGTGTIVLHAIVQDSVVTEPCSPVHAACEVGFGLLHAFLSPVTSRLQALHVLSFLLHNDTAFSR
jgi:hypothetical protein